MGECCTILHCEEQSNVFEWNSNKNKSHCHRHTTQFTCVPYNVTCVYHVITCCDIYHTCYHMLSYLLHMYSHVIHVKFVWFFRKGLWDFYVQFMSCHWCVYCVSEFVCVHACMWMCMRLFVCGCAHSATVSLLDDPSHTYHNSYGDDAYLTGHISAIHERTKKEIHC